MRVLMVSDVYFPRVNRVSTSIQTFRRDLAALGHPVDLLAPHYPGLPRPRPRPNSDPDPDADMGSATDASLGDENGILRVPSRYLFFDPEDRMMSGRFIHRQVAGLARRNYDLVHIQTPFVAHAAGLRLARAFGVPVVETYHTHFEPYLGHYLPWLPAPGLRAAARRFTRRQCNQVDAVVVPSTPMLKTLQGYGVDKPMRIIPTGLDLDRFRSGDGARFRRAHGIAPQRPVLMHVGRVAHEKNIDFLLQMLQRVQREIPDVLLMIVGEGPAQRHLERLSQRMGLQANLRFLGYLDRDGELLDCYRGGDVFVFASRTETQGLVLLEAMALGVPVVALAEMGTRDILDAGRGGLVARAEPEHFAQQVLRLLREPDLRAACAADARDYVGATWSGTTSAQRMLDLYRSLV